MKISELTHILQKIQAEKGDCEVVIRSGVEDIDYTLIKGFKHREGVKVWDRTTGQIVKLKNLFCIY